MTLNNVAHTHEVSTHTIDLASWDKNTPINVNGRYIFYLKGIADVNFRINMPSADVISIPHGSDIKYPSGIDTLYIDGNGGDVITILVFEDENAKVNIPPPSSQNSNILDGNNKFTITTTEQIIWNSTSSIKEGAIFNFSDTEIVYVGETGVTSSNGFPIMPKSGETFNSFDGNLYAVTGANTADVRMIRII